MRSKHDQRGITLVGFMMFLSLAGFFVFLGLRLFPAYNEFYAVKSDMEGLKATPNIATFTPNKIIDLLYRRFDISYVDTVKLEHIFFDKKNGYNLTVRYEYRKPLMGNLDYIARFEHTVNLAK